MSVLTEHTQGTRSAPHREVVALTAPEIPGYRAGDYVHGREDFAAPNAFGVNTVIAGHPAYVVYSWRTPILAWIRTGPRTEVLWDNECTHSSFTARHRQHALHSRKHGSTVPFSTYRRRYAFGHSGSRGDSVWYELAARVASKHGVGEHR